eukprot:3061198-Ditylum_brightwellii.AAC.1
MQANDTKLEIEDQWDWSDNEKEDVMNLAMQESPMDADRLEGKKKSTNRNGKTRKTIWQGRCSNK